VLAPSEKSRARMTRLNSPGSRADRAHWLGDLAAPGTQALRRARARQERSRQLGVEYGQLQLEASTWAVHARVETASPAASCTCVSPTGETPPDRTATEAPK